MSVLPTYDPSRKYIGTLLLGDNEQRFGCEVIEGAIQGDREDWLAECIARGYLAEDSRTFYGLTVFEYCNERGAQKCAAMLAQKGWPLSAPRARPNLPPLSMVVGGAYATPPDRTHDDDATEHEAKIGNKNEPELPRRQRPAHDALGPSAEPAGSLIQA